MSAGRHAQPAVPATAGIAAAWRAPEWRIVAALSVTETVSWGVLYYAFAVFLVPMERDLGFSRTELTGAFSLALLISGVAGIAIGRHLDRHSPRAVMSAGSIAGVALVLAWSQVGSLAGYYALWAALGVVMAAVLYEPAFVVVAKHFPDPHRRRRAMTSMTLVAALASFIALPTAQALIDAYGWRDALVVLAFGLGATTIPLHALVLRPAPPARGDVRTVGVPAGVVLRSRPFWLLATAYFLATVTAVAMTIMAVPMLLDRGHSPAFAAFAIGLVGISQIPGRLLYAPIGRRLAPGPAAATLFLLIAAGGALVGTTDATLTIVAGTVLLGMGNGMATLARATGLADLYGAAAYGTIAGVAAAFTTLARAAAPIAAAAFAAALGNEALAWSLAGVAVSAAGLAVLGSHTTSRWNRTGRPDGTPVASRSEYGAAQ